MVCSPIVPQHLLLVAESWWSTGPSRHCSLDQYTCPSVWLALLGHTMDSSLNNTLFICGFRENELPSPLLFSLLFSFRFLFSPHSVSPPQRPYLHRLNSNWNWQVFPLRGCFSSTVAAVLNFHFCKLSWFIFILSFHHIL